MSIKEKITALVAAVKSLDDQAQSNLHPGKVVTAQLGNSCDTTWLPCATVLLLAVEKGYYRSMQFYGVTRKENGELMILRNVSLRHNEHVTDYVEADGFLGFLYSTTALYFDQLEKYLGKSEAEFLVRACKFYQAEIDALPPSKMYALVDVD